MIPSSKDIRINMTGQKFGRLTVLEFSHHSKVQHQSYWKCKCDCGKEIIAIRSNLVRGFSKSCGCLRSEITSKRSKTIFTTHNLSNTRIYSIWSGMIRRCEYPTNRIFKYYGAKGIKVCEEWHDTHKFIEWSNANGYTDTLTIDRIENKGNYEPSNCQWITKEAHDKKSWEYRKRKLYV
jgi:hypothetical protein